MRHTILLNFAVLIMVYSCTNTDKYTSLAKLTSDMPSIVGKKEYLDSPFVTAGNRVYMVGNQNGTFPEIGWHIKGEMGGIWNHPIKLMDGFDITLNWNDYSTTLNNANSFTNYPMANMHLFAIPEKQLNVKRWQYVPDATEGVFIQLEIENESENKQQFLLEFTGHSDLRPTWLGERTQMTDSIDQVSYNEEINGWTIKDTKNPWFVCFASDIPAQKYGAVENPYLGNGISRSMEYAIDIAPNSKTYLNLAISGSYSSESSALKTVKELLKSWPVMAKAKKERYQVLAAQTKLTIPDKKMEQAFLWLKYNSDWLVRTVPEIGTGIGAGIPDYPWWFGVDSEYASLGYMAIGQEETVYKTVALLDSVSKAVNGNGKIIHEMSTNGAVFNSGNINETPQFASLIWSIYQWDGDLAFLEKYFPMVKDGLQWLMEENDANGNGFPEGFGMMEIHGLDSEMIDVASYTQKAFNDAAKMANALGQSGLAEQYKMIANDLREKINSKFWSEDFNSFADFIGTDQQALHLIDDAIVRADTLKKPWAIAEMEATKKFILQNPSFMPRPFVLHHNWVVNTPMEMGIADSVKAIKGLETGKKFVNPFGVFVTGIDRDESAGSNDGAYKAPPIFTYTGAVMTLPTGVQTIAENNYGRPNEALDYLERMTRSFSYALPGSMYEVSPDFGMMTQAWNIYGFAYPIVHQFFGIQPNAPEKEITIAPMMPDKWKQASLENVKVGENTISVYYSEGKIRVTQTNPEWELILKLRNGETKKSKGNEIIN